MGRQSDQHPFDTFFQYAGSNFFLFPVMDHKNEHRSKRTPHQLFKVYGTDGQSKDSRACDLVHTQHFSIVSLYCVCKVVCHFDSIDAQLC